MGLSGCGDTDGPGVGYRSLTEVELKALYTETPPTTLPVQSSTSLGEDYDFSGSVTGWKATAPLKLYFSPTSAAPPVTADGVLGTDAQLAASLKRLAQAKPEQSLMGTLQGRGGTSYCPVDTIKLSDTVKVNALDINLVYFLKDRQVPVASLVRPQTSPVPIFGFLRLASSVPERRDRLIWSPETVIVQGEQRCLGGTQLLDISPPQQNVEQINTLVNIRLERGWNALIGTESAIYDAKRGFSSYTTTWTALPAAELAKWTAYPY
ncbi:hypothetical protein [Deinococcus sp.]|uniref:hypothetical protein n=1 Tax=Deinococcus sp. TaxID=47478 RepID=UPI0025D04F39|nr:hypothetical protein [Deinococcus sp.]